jgi:hypothetical protein
MRLLARLPPPPDPLGLYPRYAELQARFLEEAERGDGERLEEAFLELYAHTHGHAAPYTPEERAQVDATGGYWCHAGGLSPILKAPRFLRPTSVSAELGAGNGLQSLLMQKLSPHSRTVMVEISSRMAEVGRHLQGWLGIPDERVEWRVGDVMEVDVSGIDFLYLYRPLRPEGPGRRFYERLAAQLEGRDAPVVVFSIADCLRGFLSPAFRVVYADGHLTCFEKASPPISGCGR